jgi:Fur family peroxide stress response transcriptional regulator
MEPTDRVEPREVERRLRAFTEACEAAGLARTHQRTVIYRALASTTTHPTAEELHALLLRELPSLALGTVYKSLTTFCGLGLVRELSPGGGPSRFDAHPGEHHHLWCRICGRVQDVSAESLEGLRPPRRQADGFRAEGYEVTFRGVCGRCTA